MRHIVIFIIIAIIALTTTTQANNPFETASTDYFIGKWSNSETKTMLLLHPTDDGEIKGLIQRNGEVLLVELHTQVGNLVGHMIQGSTPFPLAISKQGNNIVAKAGGWEATLQPHKEREFSDIFKGSSVQMQIEKTSNGFIGVVKFNGSTYTLSGESKRSLLWGSITKDGLGWPCYIHWTSDEQVEFQTGNYVEKNIVAAKPQDKRIKAEKEAERVKITWAKNNFYNNCQDGNLELVKLAIKQPDFDINQTLSFGAVGLNLAAQKGHVKIITALLQHPNIDVNKGCPLFTAACYGHAEAVKVLLKHRDTDINCHDGGALTSAAINGYVEIVKILLRHPNIDVNLGSSGNSALHNAVLGGHKEIVRLLLKHPNIDVNKVDSRGLTPLDTAKFYRKTEIKNQLLRHPDTPFATCFITLLF